MALTEDQKRLLVRYHDYVRQRGFTVCERVEGADGVMRHRTVRIGRGQDLIVGFETFLQREQTGEQSLGEAEGG